MCFGLVPAGLEEADAGLGSGQREGATLESQGGEWSDRDDGKHLLPFPLHPHRF